MTYSCVRVKKIKSATDAQNLTRHGRRAKGSFKASAVDLSRSHLNGHFVFDPDLDDFDAVDECPDYRELLDARTKQLKAKRPRNGVFGSEMMFTASPDLFRSPGGNVDIGQARAWSKACLELAREKYGQRCVAARLDLDETTPHLSVFILPMYRKSYGGEKRKGRGEKWAVSHNKVFGGPDDLSLLQDWAADGLKARGFDVKRGRPKAVTRAVNFRPDGQIYQSLLEAWETVKKNHKGLRKRAEAFNKLAKIFKREADNLSPEGRNAIAVTFGLTNSPVPQPPKPDVLDPDPPAPRM